MKRSTKVIVGVVVVGAVVGIALVGVHTHPVKTTKASKVQHHHKAKPVVHPKHHQTQHHHKTTPIPSKYPVPPATGTANGSALTSFQNVTHQAPPSPLDVVKVPWQSGARWAIEPVGMHMDGNSNVTLWFGEQAKAHGAWTWIPSTLPGALSAKLPISARQALQLGWDLSQRQPGPNTGVGNISWSALTGQVGKPAGWTMVPMPAMDSPSGSASVDLTVWQQSYTGVFNGYYGLVTIWSAQNQAAGTHDFQGFVGAPGPLSTIAQNPPML